MWSRGEMGRSLGPHLSCYLYVAGVRGGTRECLLASTGSRRCRSWSSVVHQDRFKIRPAQTLAEWRDIQCLSLEILVKWHSRRGQRQKAPFVGSECQGFRR